MSIVDNPPAQETADISTLAITPEAGWHSLYIDGDWRQGDRDSIDIQNPATRKSFATVPASTEADVDAAVEAAAAAQETWAETRPEERSGVFREVANLVDTHREDIAHLLAVESGSTWGKAMFESRDTKWMLEASARLTQQVRGQQSDSAVPGKENLILREPVGVVGVITPWNLPLYLAMRSVGPALAAGNAVVLKPDETTPLTGGLVLAKLFDEAGLPDGLLNVVPGVGSTAGAHLSQHATPSVISFTGSTTVGRTVAKNAVDNFNQPALELGGNAPQIVLEDADLDRAIDAAVFGSFVHQGQGCITINRHLVHESLYDEYVSRLADRASSLPVGDPRTKETVIGPIINEEQRNKMASFVDQSVDQGATIETGGEYSELFFQPTVLSGVHNEMSAACNEHFGPIAPVISFQSESEAIEIANDTEYGLSSSIHSTDLSRARRLADDIEAGMVHINDQTLNDEPRVPFGGVKSSGMGRFNDQWALDKFTTTKWVSVQHDPREYPF